MIDRPDVEMACTGVHGPLRLDDVLFTAKKANRLAPLQVLRADRVVGIEHLVTASRLAHRALEDGRAVADRPEVEFTRYAAARRTIRDAIEHIGIPDGAEAGIVVALGPQRQAAIELFTEALGLRTDDGLVDGTDDRLRAFGVSDAQLQATDPSEHHSIALEMVCSVDLMR